MYLQFYQVNENRPQYKCGNFWNAVNFEKVTITIWISQITKDTTLLDILYILYKPAWFFVNQMTEIDFSHLKTWETTWTYKISKSNYLFKCTRVINKKIDQDR